MFVCHCNVITKILAVDYLYSSTGIYYSLFSANYLGAEESASNLANQLMWLKDFKNDGIVTFLGKNILSKIFSGKINYHTLNITENILSFDRHMCDLFYTCVCDLKNLSYIL